MGGTRYYYAFRWDTKRGKYICIDDNHTNYALDPAFIIRPQTLIDFAWTPAERLAQQAIDRSLPHLGAPVSPAEALAGAGGPPLGVTLSVLARQIPRRIQVSSPPYGQMADITLIYDAGWDVQFAQDAPNERDGFSVEMALREEIEARGWAWELQMHAEHCRAAIWSGSGRVYVAEIGPHCVSAAAPAVALSLALAQALAGGEG
ncbi:hypothetical protein ASF71_06890 [Deinococcus sp. Leaf326]|nr:hypothetical protein ASF71_06890 [Deinococcus sp. Leaf326]